MPAKTVMTVAELAPVSRIGEVTLRGARLNAYHAAASGTDPPAATSADDRVGPVAALLGKGTAHEGQLLAPAAPRRRVAGFVPLRPLVKIEHVFAGLRRRRRLSRCYEQTAASAKAWLEVAAMGYLFARLRVEPA
ncbi:MAG: hypothetical protein P4M09_21075 [Devosia sp.]|nr:hypothetical protein [Devosia sp.]